MYGIFTNIDHKNQPNVGKYTIHLASGIRFQKKMKGENKFGVRFISRFSKGQVSPKTTSGTIISFVFFGFKGGVYQIKSLG